MDDRSLRLTSYLIFVTISCFYPSKNILVTFSSQSLHFLWFQANQHILSSNHTHTHTHTHTQTKKPKDKWLSLPKLIQ